MSNLSIFALCGAILGLILAPALLMSAGSNRYANRILAAFVGLSSLYLLALMLLHSQWDVSGLLIQVGFSTVLLNGPLLYAYVLASTRKTFRLGFVHSLHLLPMLLANLVMLFSTENNPDYHVWASLGGWSPIIYTYLGPLCYLQYLIYLSMALLAVRQKPAENQIPLSIQQGGNLHWLNTLLWVSLAITLLGACIAIARVLFDFTLWPRGIFSMSLSLYVYYLIAMMAIVRPTVFNQMNSIENTSVQELSPTTAINSDGVVIQPSSSQYENSSLQDQMAQLYWQQLQQHMRDHKPYLNNELRIKDLALSLNIPANHLSQVINQCAGKNFFEYVYHYRIETAKTLLADIGLRELNINHIALEAGFNSQSAFYKQFKKLVGKTPKQYRDQLPLAPPLANLPNPS